LLVSQYSDEFGEPQDLAKVIVNLLSDDFGWVTAQDVEVSGGHLL
jgi:NAD(P)-dependent dehydrogenase (short-subunit alcohol dehydrogenase family)